MLAVQVDGEADVAAFGEECGLVDVELLEAGICAPTNARLSDKADGAAEEEGGESGAHNYAAPV